jgi:hypothetical protein
MVGRRRYDHLAVHTGKRLASDASKPDRQILKTPERAGWFGEPALPFASGCHCRLIQRLDRIDEPIEFDLFHGQLLNWRPPSLTATPV